MSTAEGRKEQKSKNPYDSKREIKASDILVIILILAIFILIGYELMYLPTLANEIDYMSLLKIIMLAIGAIITYLWRRRIKNTLDRTQDLIKDWRRDHDLRDKELRTRERELAEKIKELSEERGKAKTQ
jgi:uncharacterized membrane protein (DUF485 family)